MVIYCTQNSVLQTLRCSFFFLFFMKTASLIASFHCNRWIPDWNTNTVAGGYISFTLADRSIWGTRGASENSSNSHIQGNRNASLQDAKGMNKRLKSQLIFSRAADCQFPPYSWRFLLCRCALYIICVYRLMVIHLFWKREGAEMNEWHRLDQNPRSAFGGTLGRYQKCIRVSKL